MASNEEPIIPAEYEDDNWGGYRVDREEIDGNRSSAVLGISLWSRYP